MAQNYVEILVRARDQGAKPEMDDLRVKLNDLAGRVAEARAVVDDTAAAAKLDDLQAKLLRLDRTTARANINMEQAVRAESQLHNLETAFGRIGDDAEQGTAKAGKALDELGKKAKDTGKQAGDGISPLLIGAFTTAAAIGPPALLAGTAVAVAGISALMLKSNAQIAGDYKQLGTDISGALSEATAPLQGQVTQAIGALDAGIAQITPNLDKLFAAPGNDLQTFTTGVVGLADNALPGVASAISNSQVEVNAFSASLPALGTDVGQFFNGLTRNAAATGEGLQSVLGTVGTAVSTLGSVLGSASAAISMDLRAIDPVINGLLGEVKSLGSPTVIGGLLGTFGAMKLDPMLSSGLTKMSDGLVSVAAKAESAGGTLGRFSGAAMGAASGLSKAADVMAGPWGIAIGAGIGLLSGWISNSQKAVASAADFTAAINEDSGVVGQNTTAAIQNQLSKANLLDLTDKLGVSQGTLIRAAAGEAGAQKLVTDAYNAKIDALRTETDERKIGLDDGNMQIQQLIKEKGAFDQVTRSVVDATRQDQAANIALADANNTTRIFNATLDDQHSKLVLHAQATAQSAVAALNLGDKQSDLNKQLYDSVDAFDLASSTASAYGTILNAQFGKYQSYSDAVSAFTVSLQEQAKNLTAGKDAINLGTEAGAKNEQILSGWAKENYAVAESLLTQTGNQDQANKALQQGAQQIDQVAKNAGFTKTQIDALNLALYGTKNIGDIKVPISADTSPALNAVHDAIRSIDGSSAYIQVYATHANLGGGHQMLATGGIVSGAAATGGPRNNLTWVGEQGPELVSLPPGTTVRSNPDSMRLARQEGGAPVPRELAVTFSGDIDSAFATAFMRMIREGKIQIKQKAIVP